MDIFLRQFNLSPKGPAIKLDEPFDVFIPLILVSWRLLHTPFLSHLLLPAAFTETFVISRKILLALLRAVV